MTEASAEAHLAGDAMDECSAKRGLESSSPSDSIILRSTTSSWGCRREWTGAASSLDGRPVRNPFLAS